MRGLLRAEVRDAVVNFSTPRLGKLNELGCVCEKMFFSTEQTQIFIVNKGLIFFEHSKQTGSCLQKWPNELRNWPKLTRFGKSCL
jgi:hypothetical protein